MNEVKINVKHPSEWEVLSDKELNAMRVVLSMAKNIVCLWRGQSMKLPKPRQI